MTTSNSDAIFSALADPTRRAILSLIGEHEELTAGEIAARFDAVGRTAVSSHLRILRLAGLIAERRDGRFRHYSVTPSPADAVVAFLTSVYQNSLDQLASAVQGASSAGGTVQGRVDEQSA
ncbi:MAG: metalloregulator ArsR/SmtB family transcription factor [bacterium]|nr:metalloregulator ArsR/SmtB family transcription factor [bacterium]